MVVAMVAEARWLGYPVTLYLGDDAVLNEDAGVEEGELSAVAFECLKVEFADEWRGTA